MLNDDSQMETKSSLLMWQSILLFCSTESVHRPLKYLFSPCFVKNKCWDEIDNSSVIHSKRSWIFSSQKSLICVKTHPILDTQAFSGYLEKDLGELSTESTSFQWLMSTVEARLNHRKLIFEEFQNCKNVYPESSFNTQTFLDATVLVRADLRTFADYVGGSGTSIIVVAKLAKVSNPVCFSSGDSNSFSLSLKILRCLYNFIFSLINSLFLSLILSCFSIRVWFI